jgi:hypothetical protein
LVGYVPAYDTTMVVWINQGILQPVDYFKASIAAFQGAITP